MTQSDVTGYHFVSWPVSSFRSLSMHLPGVRRRRGIYILTFATGERYVGQSTNVVARVAKHRRTYPDLTEVAFAALPAAIDLDQAELSVLRAIEQKGHRVRNVSLAGHPSVSPTVALYIEPMRLLDWSNNDEDDHCKRTVDDVRAGKTRQRFQTLRSRADYEDLVSAVAMYVRRVISHPRRTESHLWSISTLPSTNATPVHRRLVCISCGPRETLVITEDGPVGGGNIKGFLNTTREVPSLKAWRVGSRVYRQDFVSIGPIYQVKFSSINQLVTLLANEWLVVPARALATNLMLKGTTSYGRYHDFNLAGAVLGGPNGSAVSSA